MKSIKGSKPNFGIFMDGDDVPEWFLIEVLTRLPVKIIFRLKLVCKHWLSLISDPSFVRMYISRASLLQPLQPWIIISHVMFDRFERSDFLYQYENNYSPALKHLSYDPRRRPSTQQPRRRTLEILGVSNGLVLCTPILTGIYASPEPNATYTICNPLTGQWIVLPSPTICHFTTVHWGFLTRVEDGMLSSYRVVCFDLAFEQIDTVIFHVFFSESGEWNDFSVSSYIQSECTRIFAPPADLHGNLHWVLRNGILVYDAYEKPDDLRIIPLPRDTDGELRDNVITRRHCGVSDGKLRYVELSFSFEEPQDFTNFGVWILNDYSSGDWSLQNRITLSNVTRDGVLLCLSTDILPMAFDPYDSDIVHLKCNTLIATYNIKTKRCEAHGQPLDRSQIIDITRDMYDPHMYISWFHLAFRFDLMFSIPTWPTCIPPSLRSLEK